MGCFTTSFASNQSLQLNPLVHHGDGETLPDQSSRNGWAPGDDHHGAARRPRGRDRAVIASTDALTADVVGAKMLGFNTQAVRHLWEAGRPGLGETDTEKMEFPPLESARSD